MMALPEHSYRTDILHAFVEPPQDIPDRFVGPFDAQHRLSTPDIAQQAVNEWLARVQNDGWYKTLMSANEGKMFGVLVVRTEAGLRY